MDSNILLVPGRDDEYGSDAFTSGSTWIFLQDEKL